MRIFEEIESGLRLCDPARAGRMMEFIDMPEKKPVEKDNRGKDDNHNSLQL